MFLQIKAMRKMLHTKREPFKIKNRREHAKSDKLQHRLNCVSG